MIIFFQSGDVLTTGQERASKVFAVQTNAPFDPVTVDKLTWLFGNAVMSSEEEISGNFIGPRAAMITPWSTNAVEITQNMSISGIRRIEEYKVATDDQSFDPMLSQKYDRLSQTMFQVDATPEPIKAVDNIASFNQEEGLALNAEEVTYLEELAGRLGRPLTDSEVFGFSQVNSEHCRHKIFNGTFVIDGEEQPHSLFQMIKKTSKTHPNEIVSAYKDNVAFIKGPTVQQFAPEKPDAPSNYKPTDFESVISLKAETHNFPTTVEPFNGAATGSGGEIRDRLAGGRGSIPLAGTAVYMTSYSRLAENRPWENGMPEREWLYQTPMDILIKASNGASDFGNKFGQPLIAGSVLTFEHKEDSVKLGFDKVIMLAGGIGYGRADEAIKGTPKPGDRIVVMGGDNYRIGMGGAAVSSADTGSMGSGIELNAIQRSNPEMQKRVANTISAMIESGVNPIVSIHDHGAGGHLNCLSELVEDTGGKILVDNLPVGDPTLSAKEIIGNESQERMGLVINEKDLGLLKKVADRERAPIFDVGEVTGDHRFTFASDSGNPMDLALADMFGSSPSTIMTDTTIEQNYSPLSYNQNDLVEHIKNVLRLETVACKDWLTNKVDRCVGGRVAKQQCTGPLQLPLNNCGVMALDFQGQSGIATSIGHSPVSALIDPVAGSRNSIGEALTNIIFAPLEKGLKSISLSANWMWPCKNPGEDARLYKAVEAISQFAIDLGINVPTGKDSLSMVQKYNSEKILAPGTVIISATGHCDNVGQVVEPTLQADGGEIIYINMSGDAHQLGGSSFAQTQNKLGATAPSIADTGDFALIFDTVQQAIKQDMVAAGHDIGGGGLITTLLEMCFSDNNLGANLDLGVIDNEDLVKVLFAENCGIVLQASDERLADLLHESNIQFYTLGMTNIAGTLNITAPSDEVIALDIKEMRDIWYETSYLLDQKQTAKGLAKDRFDNYKTQPLQFKFPDHFTGTLPAVGTKRPIAALIREKGSNSEREMANALYRAGFEVRDVHMTDLITGRETLEDVQFLGAVGGFSNSDVLGSAKGWAGAFKYNEKANLALERFFSRPDTLSVGICNGAQLFLELDLINPDHKELSKLTYNESRKHESAFTSVTIQKNNSIMLSSLEGCTLGVWISHGEGKYHLPMPEDQYNIVGKYGYASYPSNPNGSDYNVAMLASSDGRHLATMPHIERSFHQWNWANYPKGRKDEVSPWAEAFVNARKWLNQQS